MADAPVTLQDVVAWVRESLSDREGLYDVQDLTFIRSSLRVVTKRRDAHFDIGRDRWPELADPDGRSALTASLQHWARTNLARA